MRANILKKVIIPVTMSVLLAPIVAPGCDFLPDEEPVNQGSAEFEIDRLTLSPSGIMTGESSTVSTTVTNVGDASGTYTAILLMEGNEISRQDVSIESDAHKQITFTIEGNIPGSYRLSLEKSSAVLTVYDWNTYMIQYDGGTSLGEHYTVGNLGHIVHFSPQSKPYKIEKVLVYGVAVLDNVKELDSRHVTLRLWSQDRSRMLWSGEFPWRVFEGQIGWKELEIPDLEVNEDFHVELVTNSELSYTIGQSTVRNHVAIGWDRPSLPGEGQPQVAQIRSGWSDMGKLTNPPASGYGDLNWFIRVEGKGVPLALSYDDGEDEGWHWTNTSHFVNFSPPATPFRAQKVLIYGYINVKDPDRVTEKKFTVRIRDQTSRKILWEDEFKWDVFGEDKANWVAIKVPDIVCEGDFYVRIITNSKDQDDCIVIGVDNSTPNRHSYAAKEVLLKPGETRKEEGADYDPETANWMVRVQGVYPGR